jgi:hypothetical protein
MREEYQQQRRRLEEVSLRPAGLHHVWPMLTVLAVSTIR